MAQLKTAVEKQDSPAFETAYRQMLTQCHACHQAAEKPFLRPQVPLTPPAVIIDMQPTRLGQGRRDRTRRRDGCVGDDDVR